MGSNITVNGVPLEVHVDKEIRKEIDEVRETENRVKRYKRPARGTGNVALSNPDKPMVRGAGLDLSTSHVMIYGELWNPPAKAPYVSSGESISGAFEINESSGEIRCHECGAWRHGVVGNHVKTAHKMSMAAYLKKHGMSPVTKTSTPAYRKTRKTWTKETAPKTHAIANKRRSELSRQGKLMAYSTERANLASKCRAQLTDRIKNLAYRLGKTPTIRELEAVEVTRYSLNAAFRLPYKEIMASIGLKPNTHSNNGWGEKRTSYRLDA